MEYKTWKDSCPYKRDDSRGHLSGGLNWNPVSTSTEKPDPDRVGVAEAGKNFTAKHRVVRKRQARSEISN